MKLIILLLVLWPSVCHAEDFDPVMMCNAIGKAECGRDMKSCLYYFGIRSVHYADFNEARHICHNTVRHSRKKWLATHSQVDFLTFLGSTYCPVKGKGLTPLERRLNVNWVKNVRYWLGRGAK